MKIEIHCIENLLQEQSRNKETIRKSRLNFYTSIHPFIFAEKKEAEKKLWQYRGAISVEPRRFLDLLWYDRLIAISITYLPNQDVL